MSYFLITKEKHKHFIEKQYIFIILLYVFILVNHYIGRKSISIFISRFMCFPRILFCNKENELYASGKILQIVGQKLY